MDAPRTSLRFRALRPGVTVAAAAVLLTGAACSGPLARRAARNETPATSVTTVVPAATPTSAAPTGQAVRTDDLEAGLQQADTQLAQTGGAVGDADQNPQQNTD